MKQIRVFAAFILFLFPPVISQADVWVKDVLDSTGTAAGINCSIALDRNGNPHISYCNGDNLYLYYAYYNGANWNIRALDSLGIAGLHSSIALDSQDRPHISYSAHLFNLRHIFWDDTGWVNQWIDSGINPGVQGFRTSIAIDNNDNPHIAYTRDDSGWVMYASYDGSGWKTELVQDITETFYVKLILKDDSIPYIGYHVLDSSIQRDTLRIAYKDAGGGDWHYTDVQDDICPSGIFYQSFDMDASGNCYFAYETANGVICLGLGDKRLARFDGSTWSYETVPDPTDDPYEIYFTFPLFLKMDRNGYPAFLADTLLYWKKDGSNWSYYGLGNQMGDESAVFQTLVFDEYNYPHMVFGQPWVVYYKLYPGSPQIVVPVTSHTYSENYTSWNCTIENHGEAPVIIDSLKFKKTDSTFQIMNDHTPFYIHSMQADSISIRFMPEAEATYNDTLLIYNNDSSNLIIEVALEGAGNFVDSTGDLVVFAHNCYAAPEYNSINYELPLAGVSISLYQDDQLKYGPIVSDFVGLALQSNITPGTYDLKIQKVVELPRDEGKALDTLMHSISIVIDSGLNVDTLILPESLMIQSYQYVYNLSHIHDGDLLGQGDNETFSYGIEAYTSGNIRDMLDLWRSDLDTNKIESAARLILAQKMVDQMFTTGRLLGLKGFNGIADLLHFSIKATESQGGWAMKILRIIKIIWELWAGDKVAALMELLEMLVQYIVIEMIDMVIDQVTDELPCIEDPLSGFDLICAGDVIKAAWKDIKDNYSSWSLPEANDEEELETSWNHLNNLVYKKARLAFIQVVYIDILTNPKLKKAKEKSEAFDYTSDFPDASESSTNEVLQMKVMADNLNYAADQMILAADLLMKTYIAMTLAQAFVPSVSIIEDMKAVTMYASIGLDCAATGVALGGFFNITVDMNDAVNEIYHPDQKGGLRRVPDNLPKAKASAQVMSMLQQKIQKSTDEYDSVLNVVKGHIEGHEIEDAMFATGDLALADVNLMRTMDVSMAPAYAVAHALFDSMPGFSGLYNGMISDGSAAGMTRLFGYMSLVQLPADSSQAMENYLVEQLDSVSAYNHTWADGSLELLDSLFGLEIPAIVVASVASQDRFGLETNDTATVTIRLQNVGALMADSVSLVFETNEGINTISKLDSIYIGSLAPGEESQDYQWMITLADTSYHRGAWTARVSSSNAKNYSPDGSFTSNYLSSTGVNDDDNNLILPDRIKLGQNYPNPFNMSTRIEYSLPSRADVTISIFNLLGRKVKTIVDKNQAAGNYSITWDGTNMEGETVASGVYFYKIKADNQTISKKMMLLK